MKEVITSKGKTVIVPDDCTGPRNRHRTWRRMLHYLYEGDVPVTKDQLQEAHFRLGIDPPYYGPRTQNHKR